MVPRGQFNRTFLVYWRVQQSQASDFSHYHLQAARSEMRGAPNSRRRPTASPAHSRLRGPSEVIAFNLPPIQFDNRE
jgi:hypothetical protein